MAFLNDTFTGTDGTFLPAHDANWEEMAFGLTGAATLLRHTIASNRLVADATSEDSQALRYNVDPGGDEYDLLADVTFRPNPQTRRFHSFFVRMDATGTAHATMDAYQVLLDGSTNTAQIYLLSQGSLTELDTTNFTWSNGTDISTFAVRVEARTTGVEVFVDDVSILSTTDTTITQRGRVGVGSSRGDGSEHYIDNLVAEIPVIRPIATATAPVNPVEGGTQDVALNGAADANGGAGSPFTWQWTQTGGTTVTLSDDTAQNPTFDAPAASTDLVFELVVTDSGSVASNPDEVTVEVIGPENTAVPFSDISVAGWSEVPDDGAPLASSIRDTTNNLYIHSPDNPNGATAEFALTTLNTIQPGDVVTLNYRARFTGGTGGSIDVTLKQGASTVIATRSHNFSVAENVFETFEDALDDTEINSITDETDLRVLIEVTAT